MPVDSPPPVDRPPGRSTSGGTVEAGRSSQRPIRRARATTSSSGYRAPQRARALLSDSRTPLAPRAISRSPSPSAGTAPNGSSSPRPIRPHPALGSTRRSSACRAPPPQHVSQLGPAAPRALVRHSSSGGTAPSGRSSPHQSDLVPSSPVASQARDLTWEWRPSPLLSRKQLWTRTDTPCFVASPAETIIATSGPWRGHSPDARLSAGRLGLGVPMPGAAQRGQVHGDRAARASSSTATN